MEEQDPRRRRLQLIVGLQERIKLIQVNIARLESQVIVAMDEKQIHEEDLQFYLQLLQELGGFESESEEVEGTTDISHAEISNNLSATSEPSTMSRADLLKLVESEEFEIRSCEVASKRALKYKCKYCRTASFTAEKELRDHVYYCTVRLPWCESYPQSCVKKRVKMTTWS